MKCKKCFSDNVIKYGHGRMGSQRMLCNHCRGTFTPAGIRGTYSKMFVEKVVHQYSHEHKKAKEVIDLYKISSRTLIKRSKQDDSNCQFCK